MPPTALKKGEKKSHKLIRKRGQGEETNQRGEVNLLGTGKLIEPREECYLTLPT